MEDVIKSVFSFAPQVGLLVVGLFLYHFISGRWQTQNNGDIVVKREEIVELKKDIRELKEAIKSISSERDEIKDQNLEYKSDIHYLTHEVKALTAGYDVLIGRIGDFGDIVNNMSNDIEKGVSHTQLINSFRKQIDQHEVELLRIKEIMDAIKIPTKVARKKVESEPA